MTGRWNRRASVGAPYIHQLTSRQQRLSHARPGHACRPNDRRATSPPGHRISSRDGPTPLTRAGERCSRPWFFESLESGSPAACQAKERPDKISENTPRLPPGRLSPTHLTNLTTYQVLAVDALSDCGDLLRDKLAHRPWLPGRNVSLPTGCARHTRPADTCQRVAPRQLGGDGDRIGRITAAVHVADRSVDRLVQGTNTSPGATAR